jgi:hypothetical protein
MCCDVTCVTLSGPVCARRPLPADMLAYARTDTRFLLPLCALLLHLLCPPVPEDDLQGAPVDDEEEEQEQEEDACLAPSWHDVPSPPAPVFLGAAPLLRQRDGGEHGPQTSSVAGAGSGGAEEMEKMEALRLPPPRLHHALQALQAQPQPARPVLYPPPSPAPLDPGGAQGLRARPGGAGGGAMRHGERHAQRLCPLVAPACARASVLAAGWQLQQKQYWRWQQLAQEDGRLSPHQEESRLDCPAHTCAHEVSDTHSS